MRHDDGIGPAVIDAFEDAPIDAVDLVQLDGESTRLIEAWRERRLAVVVDAVCKGAPPGTVHDIEIHEFLTQRGSPATSASSHHAGLAEALALGRVLDRLPTALRVLGIEPADLDHGHGLSPAVQGALAELIADVRSVATGDSVEAAGSGGFR